MKYKRLSVLLLLLMLGFALRYGAQQLSRPVVPGETGDDDPDRPAFARGQMGMREYLQARGEHLAMLRGIPMPDAEARGRALDVMDQQIRQAEAYGPQANNALWQPIGPMPIPNGQTTTVSSAVSGRVTAIAVHPTDANIVYVGTAYGGLYRSLDGGANWTPLMDSAQSLAIGAIAIAPSNPEIVYVGTGESNQSCDSYIGVGLYRIDNASTTATLTGPINPDVTTGIAGTKAFTAVAISKIVVHPTNPATIFVSTMGGIAGIGCAFPVFSTPPQRSLLGLYRSTNATAASPSFAKISITSAGSVAPDTSGDRDISDIVMEPGAPNNMLAWVMGGTGANDGGVWRSTNALAASPSFIRTQATSYGYARGEMDINKVGAVVNVVAATEEGTNGTGTLRQSSDGGATWPTSLTALGAPSAGFCSGQCWYDIAVAVNPTDANIIYLGGSANGATGSVLVKSTNGTAFSRIDTGLHADTHVLAVAPSAPTTVYVGNDGGIFRSTNSGVNWTSRNNSQFSATQFQGIAVHPSNPNFILGGTQDNGTNWRKADGTWFRADYGDGGFALIDQNAVNTTNVTMYHTYFNAVGLNGLLGLARVTNTNCASDNGSVSEWVFRGYGGGDPSTGCAGVARGANNGISFTDSAVLFYAPMALGPGNPNTLYFGTDRLYRSADRGDTMTAVSQQFTNGVPVTAIGISPQDDNVRIVGLRNGKVFRTMNGGNPLVEVTSASFPANPGNSARRFISRAIIDPNNTNVAYVTMSYYAAAGQGIWKTTNLGSASPSWVAAASGIPSVPINALVVDPRNSNRLYAGTDIGIYRSVNGGTNWQVYSTGLPRVAVFDLALQNATRLLRAGTHGRGIWEILIDGPLYLPVIRR